MSLLQLSFILFLVEGKCYCWRGWKPRTFWMKGEDVVISGTHLSTDTVINIYCYHYFNHCNYFLGFIFVFFFYKCKLLDCYFFKLCLYLDFCSNWLWCAKVLYLYFVLTSCSLIYHSYYLLLLCYKSTLVELFNFMANSLRIFIFQQSVSYFMTFYLHLTMFFCTFT